MTQRVAGCAEEAAEERNMRGPARRLEATRRSMRKGRDMSDSGIEGDLVEEFLAARVYAVVGVSTNTEKYGYKVYRDLKEGGYTVYPVNPMYEDIFGDRCYPDLASLPEKPEVVEFVCPPAVTEKMLTETAALGIGKAWMQPGAESPRAIRFCEENGIKAIHDLCVMAERRRRGKAGGKP